MADSSEDVEIKIASDAASTFVESYYPALNTSHGRSRLQTYYIKSNSTLHPSITINGKRMTTIMALQDMLENQIEKAHYEVQSYDCNVVNLNCTVGLGNSHFKSDRVGRTMSLLIYVSGIVRHWKDGQECETRGFAESIVLIPNWDAQSAKASRDAKRWLIQSQNFRLVS